MANETFFDVAEGEQWKDFIAAGDTRGRVANFAESMTSFLGLFTNKRLTNARFAVALEEAATTSDFPILLGTMLDQQLLAAYTSLPNDYREYIKTGTQSDFRKSQLVKIWGLEKPLPKVAQMGEYKQDTETEGGIFNSLTKYGKAFGLTWEDIINDRLGAFSDSAAQLSKAAYKTEYRNATLLYAAGNTTLFSTPGGAAITHPIDKAAITNSGSLKLTAANFLTVITSIRRQKDVNGEPLFFERLHLVVPPLLEPIAWQLLSPSALIISGGDSTAATKGQTQTSENILTKYKITLHVNPYLPILDTVSGDQSWYVFVDPSDAPALQLNFLRGHETPEVFMKASNLMAVGGGSADVMNGSFENDTMLWKVRHCMGGVAIDPRAAWANIITNGS